MDLSARAEARSINFIRAAMLFLVIQFSVIFQVVSGGAIFPDLPDGVPGLAEGTPCAIQEQLFQDNLRNLSLWAYEMSDASGRSARGRLRGNKYDFGSFDECLLLNGPVKGKYCVVTIEMKHIPEVNLTYKERWLEYDPTGSIFRKLYDANDNTIQSKDSVQIGWCVPSVCEASQLQSSLNQYLLNVDHILKKENISFVATVSEGQCQTQEPETFGPIQIAFITLTGVVILAVFVATFIDFIRRKQGAKQSGNKFVDIFSAIENTTGLGKANYDEGLNSINGMKFLGIIFVLVGHLICLKVGFNPINTDFIERVSRSPLILIFNTSLLVDTFFVGAGFLLAYKTVKVRRLGNPGIYILMRYISLTPSYAYIIFFYVAVFKYFGSGPLWPTVINREMEKCESNWWANLLYIANYYQADNVCIIQSWYLNCDFHFYIFGLLVMYIVRYDSKIGKYMLYLALLIFSLVPVAVSYTQKHRILHTLAVKTMPTIVGTPQFTEMYIKSHNRAQPYLIGMIGGLIYTNFEEEKKIFKPIEAYSLLFASLLSAALSVTTAAYFYHIDYVYNDILEAIYIGVYRMFWAAGTIGLIVFINFGNSLMIRNVLGWKVFVPLGRLIYGVYLVHMILILRNFGETTTSWKFDPFDMFSLLFGYLVESFAFSYLLYICIEAPVKNIYRILTTKPKPKPKATNGEGVVNDAYKTHV